MQTGRLRVIFFSTALLIPGFVFGKDYILTIGGGYAPDGNQASLEANVLFFQWVVRERHPASCEHHVYFADGFDEEEDLQVLVPRPENDPTSLKLLRNVFDLDRDRYTYRDHQVPDIRGPLDPIPVRRGFEEIAEKLEEGDRMLIYVTAHGSAAKGSDPANTSIMCWNKRALTMKSFAVWLDKVPARVPIIMVMAQCYCGGFANTLFQKGTFENGLAKGIRVGFFAQRHDLPAAGCRPDIENDEEYSSYFWGAFAGHSRTGKPVERVDCNGDGRVSFAEAHAYAVVASKTIDIPLKSSDTFLRHYSRIAGYEAEEDSDGERHQVTSDIDLFAMSGPIKEMVGLAAPELRQIVVALCQQLDISLDADVSDVFAQSEAQHRLFRQTRRFGGKRNRSSVRRDFRDEIIERWPELESPDRWGELEWLRGLPGDMFLESLKELPTYHAYIQSVKDRKSRTETSEQAELKDVLYRRLIHTLETILYSHNLPYVASPEEIDKYHQLLAIEQTTLNDEIKR